MQLPIQIIVEFVFWLRIAQSHTNGLYRLIMNSISILLAIWGIVCCSLLVHQSMNPSYQNLSETQYQSRQRVLEAYRDTKDASVFMLIVWILDIVYDIITLVFFFFDFQCDI